jgi:hypothetical protein
MAATTVLASADMTDFPSLTAASMVVSDELSMTHPFGNAVDAITSCSLN